MTKKPCRRRLPGQPSCGLALALLLCGCGGGQRGARRQPLQIASRAQAQAAQRDPAPVAKRPPLRIGRLLRFGARVYWRRKGHCIGWKVVPSDDDPGAPQVGQLERRWRQHGRTVTMTYSFGYKAGTLFVEGPDWDIVAADGSSADDADTYCMDELAIIPHDAESMRIGDDLWFASRAACEAAKSSVVLYAGGNAGRRGRKPNRPCPPPARLARARIGGGDLRGP